MSSSVIKIDELMKKCCNFLLIKIIRHLEGKKHFPQKCLLQTEMATFYELNLELLLIAEVFFFGRAI